MMQAIATDAAISPAGLTIRVVDIPLRALRAADCAS